MLCLRLFYYKFVFICGGVVLIVNFILLIVFFFIKKTSIHGSNPIHMGWVGLGWTSVMGYVRLDVFLAHHDGLG